MVNDVEQECDDAALDQVFRALADPTRRAILGRLREGDFTVSELAQPLSISLPAVSKHLKVLESAGLLERRVEGRQHYIGLRAQRLRGVMAWIAFYESFWLERLDALASYVASQEEEQKS